MAENKSVRQTIIKKWKEVEIMLEKGNIQKLEIYSDVYRNWMYAQKMEEKGNLERFCQLLTLKELEDIINWCKELENKVIFSEEELERVGRIRKTIQIVEKVRSHHKKMEGNGEIEFL